jgi:hypothetical protein
VAKLGVVTKRLDIRPLERSREPSASLVRVDDTSGFSTRKSSDGRRPRAWHARSIAQGPNIVLRACGAEEGPCDQAGSCHDEIIMKTHNSQSMFITQSIHVNSIQDYRNETLAGGELRNSQNKKVR